MVLEGWKLNNALHDILNQVRVLHPEYFDKGLVIEDKFSIFRSFKRGAHTRATEAGVSPAAIDMNNRWKKVQQQKSSMPNFKMAELYLQKRQTLFLISFVT